MRSIAVLAGTSNQASKSHLELAYETGKHLAVQNIKIISGGCKMGLMGQLCEGAAAHQGELVAVATESLVTQQLISSHNQTVHAVPTFRERKKTLFTLADGIIVLPGGLGTLDELFEFLSENQQAASGESSAHFHPIALLSLDDFFEPVINLLEHCVKHKYLPQQHLALVNCFNDIQKAVDYLSHTKIVAKDPNWWDTIK